MTDPTKQTAYRKYYHRRLQQLRDHATYTAADRAKALRVLVQDVFERATEEDNFNFTTNYARISFAAHKYGIGGKHIFQERKFRHRDFTALAPKDQGKHLFTGYKIVLELARAMFGGPTPEEWTTYLTTPYPFAYRKPEVQRRYPFLRVVAVEVDEADRELVVFEEERAERTFSVPYGQDEARNNMVAQAIAIVRKVTGVPVTLNLINAELREGGRLYPEQIVVHPDYLVDVTAVAESFESDRSFQPWSSLAGKLIPRGQELPLLRGNLVNSFLDMLIENPDLTFKELISQIFRMQPLALSLYDDVEIRKLIADLNHHFKSVQRFVRRELDGIDVQREDIILEPSFLSPAYGVQGRLDLLQPAGRPGDRTTIVELKTSSLWKPNKHQINHKNYIQTLLYDLMVNKALGKEANVQSYILYSKQYDNMLRVAPPEHFQKLEAIAARNQLIGMEMVVARLGVDPEEDLARATKRLIGKLHPGLFGKLSKFTVKAHEKVLAAINGLTDLELRYFGAYLGFIAREQQLSKTGEQGQEGINGLASLWLDTRKDKLDRFELLDGLTYREYDASSGVMTLARPENDDRLVKFRKGDLIVLYQTKGERTLRSDVVTSQVHKSSILTITPQAVRVKLRSQQLNDKHLRRAGYWSIGQDTLDSSYRNHYNGLYLWSTAEPEYRRRWLGLDPPAEPDAFELLGQTLSPTLTDQQDRILCKIIPAQDYFLLWGPPGTGKTSQMLHHLVKYLLDETNESILLVAYTNRAVDEICESIERIRTPAGASFTNYIRIGSTLGVGEQFRDRLLKTKAATIKRRAELTGLIGSTRIYVSTVASVGGLTSLFELKEFDRIIVDEASQILEPLLAGLLTRAPKALLIGDHKQLPAVVQQSDYGTVVRDGGLREAGLTSLGNSLFERLYHRAKAQNWDWAYDQLSYQGRMHEDIMAFPALHFYDDQLQILPPVIPHSATQRAPLDFTRVRNIDATLAPYAGDSLHFKLSERRILFLPTEADGDNPDPKVNGHEAELMLELIEAFTQLYADTDRPIQPQDIGVITPYRAQIAHIRRRLREEGHAPDDYQVDTVERYQGGAKRIVLISLCTNEARQIDTLSRLSDEGVDRKLNVAITRAKEHLVIVGCPQVLRGSEVYAALMEFAETRVTG